MEYSATAKDITPIIKMKNADMLSIRMSNPKRSKGLSVTVIFSGLPNNTPNDRLISNIAAIIDGTKIKTPVHLPDLGTKLSADPVRYEATMNCKIDEFSNILVTKQVLLHKYYLGKVKDDL